MSCRKRKEFPTIQKRGFPEGKGICAAGAEKGKEAIIMKKLLFTAFLTAALAAGLTASAAPADRGPEALRGPAAAPLVREDKDKDKDKGLPPGQAKKIGDRKKDLPPGIEKKLENRRDDRRDDRRGDRRYDRYDRDDRDDWDDRYDRDDRDDRHDRDDRDDRHDRHDRRWDRDDDDDDDRDDFLSNLIDQIRK